MMQSRLADVLFSIADAETRPEGYRILGHDHELIYDWRADQADEGDQETSTPLK